MWGFIHVLYLIGWGNRLGTIYTWARALTFSHNRGHRIITFEQAQQARRRRRGRPRASEHRLPPDATGTRADCPRRRERPAAPVHGGHR